MPDEAGMALFPRRAGTKSAAFQNVRVAIRIRLLTLPPDWPKGSCINPYPPVGTVGIGLKGLARRAAEGKGQSRRSGVASIFARPVLPLTARPVGLKPRRSAVR